MKAGFTSRLVLTLGLVASLPASSQVRFTQTVNRISVAESITANPSTMQGVKPGSPIIFSVQLTGITGNFPTGTVHYTMTPADGSATSSGDANVLGGTATWTAPGPDGYTVKADYDGDVDYLPQAASLSVAQPPDFDFNLPTVIINQGRSWVGSIEPVSLHGFTGQINWTCSSGGAHLRCLLPQPTSKFPTPHVSVPATVPLQIVTSAGDFVATSSLLVFGFSFRRRRRVTSIVCAVVATLAVLWASGCGSGGSAAWDAVTPKGTYHLTVTGTSGILTHSKDLTVVVQ